MLGTYFVNKLYDNNFLLAYIHIIDNYFTNLSKTDDIFASVVKHERIAKSLVTKYTNFTFRSLVPSLILLKLLSYISTIF